MLLDYRKMIETDGVDAALQGLLEELRLSYALLAAKEAGRHGFARVGFAA